MNASDHGAEHKGTDPEVSHKIIASTTLLPVAFAARGSGVLTNTRVEPLQASMLPRHLCIQQETTIPFTLADYLELIDWTGRARRDDKRGAIDARLPSIMQRLNLDADAWQSAMQLRGNVFGRALGQLDHLHLHAKTLGQSWVRGLRQPERIYRNT